MNIDYTVTALMFPAIPLMMTMYSNRFHTLSALIRQIHDQYTFEKKVPPEWENQLHVLNKRTNYLKYTMGFAAFVAGLAHRVRGNHDTIYSKLTHVKTGQNHMPLRILLSHPHVNRKIEGIRGKTNTNKTIQTRTCTVLMPSLESFTIFGPL